VLIVVNSAPLDVPSHAVLKARAENLSEAFLGLDYAFNRLENISISRLSSVLDALITHQGPTIIYYTGPSGIEVDQVGSPTNNVRNVDF